MMTFQTRIVTALNNSVEQIIIDFENYTLIAHRLSIKNYGTFKHIHGRQL